MGMTALVEQTQQTENKSKVSTVCAIQMGEGRAERVQQVKALTAKTDYVSSIPGLRWWEENWLLQIVF